MNILRGDVWLAELSNGIGSEQAGKRPVLIIQNNIGNRFSPTVIVACVTSKPKTNLPTHVDVNLKDYSTVMLEQIRTIDKRRLIRYTETLSTEDMRKVDDALLVSIGVYSAKGALIHG